MKSINITGKNNINKLNNNIINDNRNNKNIIKRSNINYEEPNHNEQIKLINKYYMHQHDDMHQDDDMKKNLIREIKSKLNGYKNQDIKKNIFNKDELITIDEIIEKLVISKLLCYYCKNHVKILFVEIRDNRQWTLDRIDNDVCHNNDNTVICCLKCNLERRVQNSNNFKFTKQLKIKKI